MTTMSIKLPEVLATRLATVAAERGVSKSAMVRQALEAFLDDARSTSSGSVAALASDLAGAVSGPSDLSSNPEHLEGYGG